MEIATLRSIMSTACVLMLWAQSVHANSQRGSDSTCGAYALYAIAKISGQDVRIETLLSPNYISSPYGSTFRDIVAAARDIGLHAVPFGDLSPADLKYAPGPLILHVRSQPSRVSYDHLVLYVGCRDNQAVLIDNGVVKTIRFQKLLASWDRAAIAVSASPPSRLRLMLPSLLFFACAALALLALRTSGSLLPEPWRISNPFCQAVVIFAIGALVGLVHNCTSDGGLFADSETVTIVEQWHTDAFLERVDAVQLRRDIDAREKMIIVDIRANDVFASGHIDTAINVPWVSTSQQFGETNFKHFGERIVLYCQNAKCPASRRAAQILISRGFTNVRVYEGGWDDWTSQNKVRR